MMRYLNNKRKNVLVVAILLTISVFFVCSYSISYASNEEPVTEMIYITISDDGDFVTGVDGTVLASTPLEVDYFDLKDYGLEAYEYSGSEGKYPTLLHAFIRATEKYYLGRKMTPEDFDTKALRISGSPGSVLLDYFWGHDRNLNYHLNHEYPEEYAGWGATCDRILVSADDTVDLAMFTNWGISSTGAFVYFKESNVYAETGKEIVLSGGSVNNMNGSVSVKETIMSGTPVKLSRDGGKTWIKNVAVCNDNGNVTLNFPEPGTYHVSAGPRYPGYEKAVGADYECVAPPICIINVSGSPVEGMKHNVRFDTRGGSAVSPEKIYKYRKVERPSDPERTGFDFLGWFCDPELTRKYDFDNAVTGELTLYAGWKAKGNSVEDSEIDTIKPVDSNEDIIKPVKPGRVTIKSVKPGRKRLTVIWKKVKDATGYKIRVRIAKQGKKKAGKWKTYTVKAPRLKKVIKGLKKGKRYQVSVRAYRKSAGHAYYGKWSKMRKVKVR